MKYTFLILLAGLIAGYANAEPLIWNFDADPLGDLLVDSATFDYEAGTEYVVPVAVNTLGVSGRSAGTDYSIVDKGGEHTSALKFRTVNTSNSNFGVYMNRLDFTLDGANASQVIQVSYSFDILAHDTNESIDPTDWTVKYNGTNTSAKINVSDAWFDTLSKTFSFQDNNTTWTTVTGSFVIGVGEGGHNGGIQISTDKGSYTSAGGFFFDNIQVTIEPAAVPEPSLR